MKTISKMAAAALVAALVPFSPAAGETVRVVPGATEKVCQVTGQFDRQRNRPTVNETETRAKFWGTDLGASFEHEGRLVVLFGDTHPTFGTLRPRDADSIAFSTTTDPRDCLRLDFMSDPDGGYRPLTIPGIFQGAFAVPTGGLSLKGRMYVFSSSDVPGRGFSARAVLARSDDGGMTFRRLYDVSADRMAHISPALVKPGTVAGLPPHAGDGILVFGTGPFRRSQPYLAFIPADEIENPAALLHYAGLDGTGSPVWSRTEADGVPLFDQPCLGEFSAGWNPVLSRWLMLYTCGGARATTYIRTAEKPWGPWSDAEILVDPAALRRGCDFINQTRTLVVEASTGRCAAVSDPHTPFNLGEAYGPYLISRFTTGDKDRASAIYFLMSTWNPYNVVLMRTVLSVERAGAPNAP